MDAHDADHERKYILSNIFAKVLPKVLLSNTFGPRERVLITPLNNTAVSAIYHFNTFGEIHQRCYSPHPLGCNKTTTP